MHVHQETLMSLMCLRTKCNLLVGNTHTIIHTFKRELGLQDFVVILNERPQKNFLLNETWEMKELDPFDRKIQVNFGSCSKPFT
jgi:hypothetical protein